jgi:menaquinone-specific isochorismate synthase
MLELLLGNFQKFLDHSVDQNTHDSKKMGQFIFHIEREILFNGSKNIFLLQEAQFFWKQPEKGLFFHSLGRIDFQKVFGFNRLIFSKNILDNLRLEITGNEDISTLKRVPFFLGNEEFAPFSKNSIWAQFLNFNWFIPKLLLLLDKSNSILVYNFSLKNEKKIIFDEFSSICNYIFSPLQQINQKPFLKNRINLDYSKWEKLVDKALKEIKNKKFDKVVLSRNTEFDIVGNIDISLLESASERYPECITFFNKKDNSLFLGISPERLLKISDNKVYTEALAGSIKRSGSSREDSHLSEQLLGSGKNLMEQKYVTDYILSRLKLFTSELNYNEEPELIKLENIQHLKTKFNGLLKEDKFFFDLIKELQPTPAVCGCPGEEAYKFIIENEGYDRGLYSGITGWFNLYDEGEFAVSIRSALIKGEKLYAFSGCGIVEGSNPRSEYEETEIKLKPILSIFGYEN